MIAPASVATDWWHVTGDGQPDAVLGRMLHPDDVARTMLWILEQPDHVQIGEVVVLNGTNPWQP